MIRINLKSIFKVFPSWQQWKKVSSVLNTKERYFIFGFSILAIVSLLTWLISSNLSNTTLQPNFGGSFSEGIVGAPQYLNPVLSQSNDADRDVVELIFSGLTKYNSQGELVPDLVEKYAVGEGGKVYDFFLRKNIEWHDGEVLTADDVIFTIQAIQNPEYRSPLRINWTGVEVEKVDEWTIRFKLKTPYAPFLANTTVGIVAEHIWGDILPANFALSPENLEPIGTGLYKFKKLKKDKEGFVESIELEAFGEYNINRPYIEKISLLFYPDEESLIRAYNKGQINNISLVSVKNKPKLQGLRKTDMRQLNLPRYFTVFFNQSKSKALSDKNVRLALNYATDKEQIINNILSGEARSVDSPIPIGVWGHTDEIEIYNFSLDQANNILDENEWIDKDGDGIREKGEEKLEIELITTELKELQQVANVLQEQWSKIGVQVNVKILSIGEIQQEYIRPREYQALLFGEVLGLDPDPYSFWHSSQKKDPGLNLALYDNKKVDDLLKSGRQNLDEKERLEDYKKFQQLVVEDAPVVFLYSSYHLYFVDKKIKGVEVENIVLPSKRFSDIENWYIKTQRVKNND